MLNGRNGPGGQQQLLPHAIDLEDVQAVRTAFVDVRHHLGGALLAADVRSGRQHFRHIVRVQRERRYVARHLRDEASGDFYIGDYLVGNSRSQLCTVLSLRSSLKMRFLIFF